MSGSVRDHRPAKDDDVRVTGAAGVPTRWSIVTLAVPVIFANIGVSLAGIADTAVMGRMADPIYLSATAVGATFFSTLYWAFGFLRMSTGGLVAQAEGAQDSVGLRRVVFRALAMSSAIGVLVLVLQWPLLSLALMAINEADGLHALITQYVSVRVWSAPATLGLFVLYGTLVGKQWMRQLLALQLFQTGSNVALNLLFFSFTDLAIYGVALATVIADYLSVILALAVLWPALRGETSTHPWLFDRASLVRLFSLSGDLFVRSLFLTAAYFWLTAASSRLGVGVVAANAVLLLLVTFTAHFLDGFAHAAEALVGNAIGARKPAVLHASIEKSAQLSLVTAVALTVAYMACGPWFIDAITTDEGTRQAARDMLVWVWLLPLAGVGSFLLDGIFIGATTTRAMRDTVVLASIGFFAATWLLMPMWGNNGLWASYIFMQLARAVGLGALLPGLLRNAISRTHVHNAQSQ